MPQPENGAASESVITQQAPVEQSTSTAVEPQTETQTTSSVSIMDKLGISAEAQAELKAHKPTEEPPAEPVQTEQPTETTTAEAQLDPEQHGEESEDSEPKPNKDWAPEVQNEFKKRVGKEARKRRKADERADLLEQENEQLRATLENTQPVTVAPTPTDLFADVQNPQQLEQRLSEWRLVRDWCRKHPQGYTAHEGTDNEEFVAPEVVAERLSKAEDAIMFEAPKKAVQLQQRQQYDVLAKQHYAPIFDRSSEDYQVANALVQQVPGLANHPGKNLILGDYLRGVRQRLAEAKPNGAAISDPGAEKLRQAKAVTPPIAPPVPSARSNGATPSRKKVDEAMNNVIREGGSPESITAALRARREASSVTANSREPVLV